MKIKIQSIKFDATEKLVDYTEKKVGKLGRFIEADTADVVFKVTKPQTANNKEVTLKIGGLIAEKVADTFEDAIDGAIDALKTQIEKKKKKGGKHEAGVPEADIVPDVEVEDDEEFDPEA